MKRKQQKIILGIGSQFGKLVQQRLGLIDMTVAANAYRRSIGLSEPVQAQTVERYNGGGSGYARVPVWYAGFLQTYVR